MKTRIALAALGAALVFGCGNAEKTHEVDAPSGVDAPTQQWDRTQGGVYTWGTVDGRDTVIAVDGIPVPDHLDMDALDKKLASDRGVSVEQHRRDVAPNLSDPVQDDGPSFDRVIMPPPGDVAEKATAHHPMYQYGFLGLANADLQGDTVYPGQPTGAGACTCTGQGGQVGSPHGPSQISYSCQQLNSGNHTAPFCFFPRSTTWFYYMGDAGTWGDVDNLNYMRARMITAFFNWRTIHWNFSEVFTLAASQLTVVPNNFNILPTERVYAHTSFVGHIQDEGDLPIQNVQRQRNAKAYSYAGAQIIIDNGRVENASRTVQAQRGVFLPTDFANAYESILAHEVGHVMGLPHFTNGTGNTGTMVPGCLGADRLLPVNVFGGVIANPSDYLFALNAYNPNSFGNTETALPVSKIVPSAFTTADNNESICGR